MYPITKTFLSKQANSLYWRGKLDLIDNTSVEFLVLESVDEKTISYSIALTSSSAQHFQSNQLYSDRSFDSAWKAIYLFERDLNREIFKKNKT
jgi:hypothetical protein